MSDDCRDAIVDEIRRSGPVTVARFMELALYHPEYGYYARAARRSGRAGDFFTSVDVGPVFGELLATQFAEMWRLLRARLVGAELAPPDPGRPRSAPTSRTFDLVEAGAGNGRLAADVLQAARSLDPGFYDAINLALVERSGPARDAQPAVLGVHASKLTYSGPALPDRIDGVVYANELLDALPAHVVVMRDTLREIRVDWDGERLVEREDLPSTPALDDYLDRLEVRLEPGWRVEINLAAVEWIADAANRLARGFLMLIDYGHDARRLYASSHSAGTLTSFSRHTASAVGEGLAPFAWLEAPGSVDMTSHVDLTTIQRTAESAGLETLGVLDQTYFLLGLGLADHVARRANERGHDVDAVRMRLAVKTLVMPGGLGSVQKVMIFGRHVGRPALRGCSYKVRVT